MTEAGFDKEEGFACELEGRSSKFPCSPPSLSMKESFFSGDASNGSSCLASGSAKTFWAEAELFWQSI